jgi:hypothetical protein
MPPKTNKNAPDAMATRVLARNRTIEPVATSSDVALGRITRSTRLASTNASVTVNTRTKRPTGTLAPEIPRKLRPLTDRNANNSRASPAEDQSGAAMLAATKKALRPVAVAVQPDDREQMKVDFLNIVYLVLVIC